MVGERSFVIFQRKKSIRRLLLLLLLLFVVPHGALSCVGCWGSTEKSFKVNQEIKEDEYERKRRGGEDRKKKKKKKLEKVLESDVLRALEEKILVEQEECFAKKSSSCEVLR